MSPRLSDDVKAEAKRMRAAGARLADITAALGISRSHVQRLTRASGAPLSKKRSIQLGFDGVEDKRVADVAKRLLRQIPADTRGLTARLAGDPLPGRSALDRSAS